MGGQDQILHWCASRTLKTNFHLKRLQRWVPQRYKSAIKKRDKASRISPMHGSRGTSSIFLLLRCERAMFVNMKKWLEIDTLCQLTPLNDVGLRWTMWAYAFTCSGTMDYSPHMVLQMQKKSCVLVNLLWHWTKLDHRPALQNHMPNYNLESGMEGEISYWNHSESCFL